MTEETLVTQAMELTTIEERRAFLDGACGRDTTLRDRAEQLLEARTRVLGHLDATNPESGRPTIAGRYEVIEQIGEGGMGTVYLAEQTEPVRRRVALKLIRRGMDSRIVLARFEAERQALALMDHPNIARVFDGGTAEDGRPFFVMEYVEGVPLTQYCDTARLGVPERLALFTAVCRAVQHAHTKGIIHRDLKPSNILVGESDGRAVPKVIDFGLVKATGEPLVETTAHTAPGATMGTPMYMSPEQAVPGNPDIDARADVYALGVILYELLTGSTPLERRQIRGAAWFEILRMIKEDEPPRPSVRLSGIDSLSSVAALRQLEPTRLTRLVRGDLDWIVMKCLEKERSRRYETPSDLARDVERYLEDESVEACPPSAGYRLGKFLRRNRGVVAAASIILLLLVGGIVGTSWGLYRADLARKAESERAEGERRANAEAQRRLIQIEEGAEILASVFDDLDPREEEKAKKPLRAILGDRLARAGDRLDAVGDPLTVAGLQDRLGRSLMHLGLAPRAIPLFEKARATRSSGLGLDDPATLESMNNLAEAYGAARKMDLAMPLLEQTLALRKVRLGVDHNNTLESMINLAEGYQSIDRLDLALPLYEETLRLTSASLGPGHYNTVTAMNNLAVCYQNAGKPQQALPLLERSLAMMKEEHGPTHPDTLAGMNNLAAAYRATGKVPQAVAIYEEALKLFRSELGPDHPDTITALNNLSAGYKASGHYDRMLPLLREAAAGLERRRFEVQNAGRILGNFIATLEFFKHLDEAEAWRRKWLAVVKEGAGARSLPYAIELRGLGSNLIRQKDWSQAEPLLREALDIQTAKAPDSWSTHETRSLLGEALIGQKNYSEAEILLLKSYETMQAHPDKPPPTDGDPLADARAQIVRLYEAWGRPDKAAEWKAIRPKPADLKSTP